jgi:chorismate synthase
MLRFLTSGESHGKSVLAILEGIPAGLNLSREQVDSELAARQSGYGRGGRMKIEHDSVEVISGLRGGVTIGSPITLLIGNKDWENWKDVMDPWQVKDASRKAAVTRPRPGHADLSGALKHGHTDVRNVLERASARETAPRVAVGAVCKAFLAEFGIEIVSHVVALAGVKAQTSKMSAQRIREASEKSSLRCADQEAERKMIGAIDRAIELGDSLGGIVEVRATGVPVGLGSYSQWDRKLESGLAAAVMSVQAIKGVEIGLGFAAADRRGSQVHDEILYSKKRGFYRKTNRAGGIEGGVSNGEDIVLKAAMKPIPTLRQPLSSVDMVTKETFEASVERSDVVAVPAASVVAGAAVAFVLADAMLEKFGGDSIVETRGNYDQYVDQVSSR